MKKILGTLVLTGAMLVSPLITQAASMSLYFGDNFIEVGKEFSVALKIDSEGVSINAAQTTLSYPKDILEIKSVDKSGSVFNFWLEEPSFDNTTGKLSFIGGATAGYSGKSLQVLTMNFRAKNSGRAPLSLTDGAITAADGSGTNVLSKLRGTEFFVAPKSEIETIIQTPPSTSTPTQPTATTTPTKVQPIALLSPILPKPTQITRPPVKSEKGPSAPKIEVLLYPDRSKWHNVVTNFLVRWELPADISDVATAVNRDPKFNPAKSEGLFDNKFFPALPDGVSYLHIRFKNNVGWGETTHYPIMIDTAPPSNFFIKMEGAAGSVVKTDNPAPALLLESRDQLSGIDRYLVQIDSEKTIETADTRLITPLLAPGKHLVNASARDLAGNSVSGKLEVEILPIALPLITSVSREVFINEGNLNLSGTTLPNAGVIVSVIGENGETVATKELPADKNGNWSVKFDEPLKRGVYSAKVTAKDNRGALSLPVSSETIRARAKPLLMLFGLEITELRFFVAVIAALLLAGGAGFLSSWLWHRQMTRRTIIAAREVNAILSSIEKDLLTTLKKYKDKKVTAVEAVEVSTLLQRVIKHISNTKKYLVEEVEEIKD